MIYNQLCEIKQMILVCITLNLVQLYHQISIVMIMVHSSEMKECHITCIVSDVNKGNMFCCLQIWNIRFGSQDFVNAHYSNTQYNIVSSRENCFSISISV